MPTLPSCAQFALHGSESAGALAQNCQRSKYLDKPECPTWSPLALSVVGRKLSVLQFACMLINVQQLLQPLKLQLQWWRHDSTLAAWSHHAKLDDTSEASLLLNMLNTPSAARSIREA